VKIQIEEAAHASPVATVLLDYAETRKLKKWEGTPSQLFTLLLNHAKQIGVSTNQKAWPKAPHVLVRQLNELEPSLKSLSWEVTTGIKLGGTRKILIQSVPSDLSDTGQEKKDNNWDGRDARDAIPPNSSKPLVSLDDLKSVHWDAQFYDEHECAICDYKKLTSWKAELFKGPDVPICEDCKLEWEKRRKLNEGTKKKQTTPLTEFKSWSLHAQTIMSTRQNYNDNSRRST